LHGVAANICQTRHLALNRTIKHIAQAKLRLRWLKALRPKQAYFIFNLTNSLKSLNLVSENALRPQPLALTGLLETAKRLGKEIGVTALKRTRSVAQSGKAQHCALWSRKPSEGIGRACRVRVSRKKGSANPLACAGVACAEEVANPLKQTGLLIYAIDHIINPSLRQCPDQLRPKH
jgi:hypothetical protein